MYLILKGSLCRGYLLKQGLLDGKRQITLGLFLTFRHNAVPEGGGCAVASVPAAPRALPRVSLRKRRATVVLDPVASVAVQGLALPARTQLVGAAWPTSASSNPCLSSSAPPQGERSQCLRPSKWWDRAPALPCMVVGLRTTPLRCVAVALAWSLPDIMNTMFRVQGALINNCVKGKTFCSRISIGLSCS